MTEVVKRTGEIEPLQVEKLQNTIARVGGSYQLAEAAVKDIMVDLPTRVTTHELYRRLFQRLRQEHPAYSLRLNLKQAIAALGPTGFPFEQFIAKVLERAGYRTQANLILPGKCVQHEVDVWAMQNDREFLFECKFHQQADKKSNIQAALYSYARVLDLNDHEGRRRYLAGLITNTKLSLDAIHYGECQGMHLIAWGYPFGTAQGKPFDTSLERLVEQTKSYPITTLTALSRQACGQLVSEKIVLVQDLLAMTELQLQQGANLSVAVSTKVRREAELLLE